MRDSLIGGQGNFDGYSDLIRFWDRKRAELKELKGISLKNEKGKTIGLQFTLAGKRVARSLGEPFTEDGMVKAVVKARKVYEFLQRCDSVTEFESWYRDEILGENVVKDDRLTYRQIFDRIETEYWQGVDKNTKKPRQLSNGQTLKNHVVSYHETYGRFLNYFEDWDKYPSWEELERVLFSWQQGTKSFKDAYSVIKKIVFYFPKSFKADCLNKLDCINPRQTIFREKTRITEKEFLDWHNQAYEIALNHSQKSHGNARLGWLWVASMAFVYGLRPTEIAAAQNLVNPYQTKSGEVIKAISDPSNKDLILVLGELTYFGIKIKTGGRICKPLTLDREIIEQLRIQDVRLPIYTPRPNSNEKSVVNGFTNNFRKSMISMGCPTTQCYAFRHAGNAQGEKSGIPQEIRARSMGHSKEVNDRIYRDESNEDIALEILMNHSRQPLTHKEALFELEANGIDVNDPMVSAVLKIIYRM
ncbi:hypothetical protein V0288_04615 [Pannus brasiliensis CCIBt3594]|uniref:Integrase n=1 Tax=Pannus brasiliensis CCIBt3594 TaxID=1427578 RepID=A0AAW9QUW0_9CHRO